MAEQGVVASSVADEWQQLADRVDASIFLRPGYVEAVCAACAEADSWPAVGETAGRGALEIVTHRRQGRLVAVAPILRDGGHCVLATHWEALGDDGLVADDPEAVRTVVETVLGAGAHRLSVPFRNPSGVGWERLRKAAREIRCPTSTRPLPPAAQVDLAAGFESYWSSCSRSLRKDVRRRLRRLEDLGDVRLDVVRCQSALAEVFHEMLQLEASGWKGAAGTAILCDPPAREFFARASRWAAGQGALCVHLLRIDERLVAFDLGLLDGEVLYLWKSGYDEELARCSPGKLVLYLGLRRAAEGGVRRVELMGSPEPYKQEWATGYSRPTVLEIFAPTVRGGASLVTTRLVRGARRCGRRAIDTLRRESREL